MSTHMVFAKGENEGTEEFWERVTGAQETLVDMANEQIEFVEITEEIAEGRHARTITVRADLSLPLDPED